MLPWPSRQLLSRPGFRPARLSLLTRLSVADFTSVGASDPFPARHPGAVRAEIFSSPFLLDSIALTWHDSRHLLRVKLRTPRNNGFAACSWAERTIRWNAMGGCCRLRTMYKRIVVLGILGLLFVLGVSYLLVYTLSQQVVRERERQDRVYWSTFNAIEQFGERPDTGTEQKAKSALEEARQRSLNKDRVRILQNYLQDLERCYQGERESCKKANSDMNEAIRVPKVSL